MPFPLVAAVAFAVSSATAAAAFALAGRPRLAAAVAFAGATIVLIIHGPLYFDFYADDAYITLRYSQHLADGLGPNWNSTGRVEGYTTFLWMGIHAGLARLGVDIVAASRVLGFASVLATFVALDRIWRLWAKGPVDGAAQHEPDGAPARPLVPALAMLALALTGGVAFWGFSGMETTLFMALLTWAAYAYMRERAHARGGERRTGGIVPLSALLFAAAAMARPEGLVAAAVTGVFVVVEVADETDRRRAIVRIAGWGAVFAAVFGSYFLWRYTYYDYLLPNTFYAKVGATAALYERGLDYVWTYGLRYQMIPLFAGLAFLLTRARLRRDAAYILALTAAMLAAVAVAGGDDFPHGRMVVPILPLLYLGGLAGLAAALRTMSLATAQRYALAGAVLALAALSLVRASLEFEAEIALERTQLERRELLGRWLSTNTPDDYTIAAFAVGAVGYYSDRDVLDLLGLNDVVIAHTDVPGFGRGIAGHEKYNVDYVLDDVRPEIIIPNDSEPGPLTEAEQRERFARPSPVRARDDLLTDPRLWQLYRAVAIEVDGVWFNILQRADTLADDAVPSTE